MDEAVQHQSHKSFKIFAGTLGENNSIDDINEEIGKFVTENGVAAKSIGVEFLESANRLIFTLGYRTDEPSYAVKLTSVSLGKADVFGDDFSALEAKMSEAATNQKDIICHELFVTKDGDFFMAFMTLA